MGLDLQKRRVWLIAPGKQESLWAEWLEQGWITMGFGTGFGNATQWPSEEAILDRLREISGKANPTNDALAIYEFTHKMAVGDLVFVKQGRGGLLGVGEISGDYTYVESRQEYQHIRKVVWVKKGRWSRKDTGPVKTLTDVTGYDWKRHEELVFDGPAPRCWIFQGNPKRYDFERALKEGSLSTFHVSAHKDRIQPGDLGILWLTGAQAGCYALLKVTSSARNRQDIDDSNWTGEAHEGDYVTIEITHSFIDDPILKIDCDNSLLLAELNVGYQGTNFQASLGQHALLKSMRHAHSSIALGEHEQVWLIHSGAHDGGEHGKYWRKYLDEGIVAMSGKIGDIRGFENKGAIEQALFELMPKSARSSRPTQTALAYEQFARTMKVGDLVVVRSHQFFVGVGKIESDYDYDTADAECNHKRKVSWLAHGQTWAPEGWTWKKLTEIRKYSRESGIYLGYEQWIETANLYFLPPNSFPVNTWWVNQGGSFDPQNPQIWAPETMANGHVNRYHRYVQDIRKGDLIVHYSRGIRGFSVAKHDAESRVNPFGSGLWEEKGFGLDVEFHPLQDVIPLTVLQGIEGFFQDISDLTKTDHPFDKRNEVKQGYLFPFSLAMLVDIQENIAFSFPEPIRGFLRGLEATQDSASASIDETSDSMDSHEPTPKPALPTNKIFYGPPGTGKTYYLQANLLGKYQSKTSELSREELLDQFALKITWAEACVLALLELEKANVLDLLQHEIILSKARVSASKRPYQTLSTTLLEHVPESCEFVNVKTRRTNSYFWKNGEGKNAFFTLYDGIELAEFESLRNEMDRHLKAQQQNAHGAVSNHFEFVTFHQSFSYEDFVEGIKPVMEEDGEGELKYQIEPGVFKTICNTARRNPGQRYAIFIDEINRGNVASIFGELITLIEPDKREGQANELSVRLPYSKEEFSVPSNLDIYGTMNTADRSVEALDTALRRRFEFEEIGPNWNAFQDKVCEGINLGDLLCTINQRIEHLLDKDHCIGHSYFYKVTDFQSLQQVFAKNILPLLQEYFYGDFGKVGLILGNAFVQVRNERQTSFAIFDHPDADLLQEKVVYDLQDPTAVEAEGYRAIYS